jgi:hypothetical protein
MKSFAVLLVMLVFATIESSRIQTPAQRIDDNFICPTILVECPETNPGQGMRFRAKVYQGVHVIKLNFKWKVTNGKITSGQGTEEITVKSKARKGQQVIATAELIGTPKSCNNKASCRTAIAAR